MVVAALTMLGACGPGDGERVARRGDDDTGTDTAHDDDPVLSNPGYTPEVVEQTVVSGSIRQSALTWDPASDTFVAVWGTVPDTFHTSATTLAPGVPVTVGTEVRVDETVYDGADPEVAVDGEGSVMVVFADDRLGAGSGLVEIYAQVLDSGTLAPRGGNFRVSQTDSTNDWNPAVAHDSGTFLVAWGDDRAYAGDDRRQLWARTVGLDGTLGEAAMVGPESSYWQVLPSIAGAGGRGRFLVVWGDYDLVDGNLDAGYRARILDSSGQALSDVITLVRYGNQIYDRPTVAWNDEAGAWLVAWMLPYEIHASWVSFDGEVSGGNAVVSPDTGAGAAQLAWSPHTNSFALAYHAWWTNQGYLQELDDNGVPSGDPHLLTATTPALGTFWQPVAASTDGVFMSLPVLDYNRLVVSTWRR